MKKAANNRQRYKDAFEQFQLSEDAYRQIRNMEETIMDTNFRKKRRNRAIVTAMISLATLAIAFVSANGIVYAATGNTLVEKISQQVSIYIDGRPAGKGVVKFGRDKDGNPYYQIEADDNTASDPAKEQSSSEAHVFIAEPVDPEKAGGKTDGKADGKTGENFTAALKEKNNKIFLVLEKEKGESIEVDITKDFADGKADGTFEADGQKYQYKVTGNMEEYSVEVTS